MSVCLSLNQEFMHKSVFVYINEYLFISRFCNELNYAKRAHMVLSHGVTFWF